jgi:broad specificity phosphatase PhoE
VLLYCLRHGQTNYNVRGLCNDDPRDAVHLTDLGRAQAAAAAGPLRAAGIERIFVSQLPRTRETAGIVNAGIGAPIEADARLNDIRSGFNNRPVAEYFAAAGHDRLHARINGGESLLDYRARVLPFLDDLSRRPERCVLVVAHEETLRVIVAHLRGLPAGEMERLHFPNCEIVRGELPAAGRTAT